MKKIVYIVELGKIERDSWHKDYSFNLNEARKAAKFELSRLTEREKKESFIYINGYEIEAEDGQSIKEAFEAWEDVHELDDPDYFEEIL